MTLWCWIGVGVIAIMALIVAAVFMVISAVGDALETFFDR